MIVWIGKRWVLFSLLAGLSGVLPGAEIRPVSSEPELQSALASRNEDVEIVLSPGIYRLTQTLCVRAGNVTIRGTQDAAAKTVLRGPGMEKKEYGAAPHAIWCEAPNLTVTDLTIRDFYFHGIMLNPGSQRPRIERVRFLDMGEQFVKASPRAYGVGVDNGIVRDCSFVYENGPPRTDHGGGVGYTNGIDVHAGRNWIIQARPFSETRF